MSPRVPSGFKKAKSSPPTLVRRLSRKGVPIEKQFRNVDKADQATAQKLLVSLDRDLRRFLYLSHFPSFVKKCLGLGFIPGYSDPGVTEILDKYQGFLTEYLAQKDTAEKRFQVMVIVPRECMKSTSFTGPTHLWLHLRDSEYAGCISSANYDKMAKKFSGVCRALMSDKKSELFELFGPFEATGNWTDEKMISAKRQGSRGDPTLLPVSVETGATSGHFNGFTLDDPVTEAQVVKFRDSWWPKLYAHYNSLDFVVNKEGLLSLIGTRYGEQDLFGYVIENEILPAVITALGEKPDDFDERWDHYANLHSDWHVILRKVHNADGSLNFPVIWPEARINETRTRAATGETYYACQLQNEPATRKDNPVQKQHIDAWWLESLDDVPPAAFNRLAICMDTAWKDEKAYMAQSGDWNVIQVWAQDAGHVYLLNQWHGRVTQEKFGRQFLRLLQWCDDQMGKMPEVLTYDKPVGGAGSSNRDWFLKVCHDAGYPCPPIVEIPRKNTKISEILGITGYIQDGRVHVLRGIEGANELVHEATHIGFSKHDDHIDVLKDIFHPDVYRPPRRATRSAKERKIVPFESLFAPNDDEFQPDGGRVWMRN